VQLIVESEYVALVYVIKEFIWLCYLLKNLSMSKYEPTVLYCDDQGAISLAKNPSHHAKMKHFDMQLHFIMDHIEKGTIQVNYCPVEDILADIMTKGLVHERHEKLLEFMSVGTIIENTTLSSSARSMSRSIKLYSIYTTIASKLGGNMGASWQVDAKLDAS
jgi:hypothetical protein